MKKLDLYVMEKNAALNEDAKAKPKLLEQINARLEEQLIRVKKMLLKVEQNQSIDECLSTIAKTLGSLWLAYDRNQEYIVLSNKIFDCIEKILQCDEIEIQEGLINIDLQRLNSYLIQRESILEKYKQLTGEEKFLVTIFGDVYCGIY